jgi:hypothetical protein
VLACQMLTSMKHRLVAIGTSRGGVVLISARVAQAPDAATSCCQIHPHRGLCNDPECTNVLLVVSTCYLLHGIVVGATLQG